MITIYKNQLLILFVTCFASAMSLQNKFLFLKNDKVASKLEKAIKRTRGVGIVESLLRKEYKEVSTSAGQKIGTLIGGYSSNNKGLSINLSNRRISCLEDIKKIIKNTSKRSKTKVLNLSYNEIEKINISQLRKFFPQLEEIDLSYNNIKEVTCSGTLSMIDDVFPSKIEFIKYFFKALYGDLRVHSMYFHPNILKKLNLSHNCIENFNANYVPAVNLYIDLSHNQLSYSQQTRIKKAINSWGQGCYVSGSQHFYHKMVTGKFGSTSRQHKVEEFNNGHITWFEGKLHHDKFTSVNLDNQGPNLEVRKISSYRDIILLSDL